MHCNCMTNSFILADLGKPKVERFEIELNMFLGKICIVK